MVLLKSLVLILAAVFLPYICCDDATGPIVTTNLGKIKGSVLKSDDGLDFFAFRGIPFAKPPVKELRFKAPQALIDKWDGVFDATEDGAICIQDDIMSRELMGDEDCLYLNVYTPKVEDKAFENLLPVMVFIHGGGYYSGTGASSLYGPQRLMDKPGIILVTINYRLGPFGFLTTLDENSPGNYGLLDQVMALQWIRDNIAEFGGNPNRVTIFGESAGSASVSLHMISPLSKGLFHAAIAQSGSVLSEWALWHDHNITLNNSKELAKLLKCPTDCHRTMMKCLRKLPSLDIIFKASQQNRERMDECSIMALRPVVDLATRGKYAFLPDEPYNLLTNKQFYAVPFMAGATKDEGAMVLDLCYGPGERAIYNKKRLSSVLKNFISSLLKNGERWERTSEDIISSYYNGVDDADDTKKAIAASDLISDSFMNYKIDVQNEIFASYDLPTYVYKLTYSGEHTIVQSGPKGLVSHIDDLQYLFRCSYFKSTLLSSDDKRMADIMLTLWTNFAKTGVPSLEGSVEDDAAFKWERATSKSYKYLDLNLTPSMVEGHICNKYDLWKKAYSDNLKDEL